MNQNSKQTNQCNLLHNNWLSYNSQVSNYQSQPTIECAAAEISDKSPHNLRKRGRSFSRANRRSILPTVKLGFDAHVPFATLFPSSLTVYWFEVLRPKQASRIQNHLSRNCACIHFLNTPYAEQIEYQTVRSWATGSVTFDPLHLCSWHWVKPW